MTASLPRVPAPLLASLAVVALVGLPSWVSAQDASADGGIVISPTLAVDADADADTSDDPFADERFPGAGGWTHSVVTTAQIIYLPDFILDGYFDRHGSHWDGRSNLAFGVEYILRRVDSWELRAGVIWSNISMPATYWLESGKTTDAADYTRLDLSVLGFEVAFFGTWDIIDEIGIFYGGGLWGGAILGSVEKANIMQECARDIDNGDATFETCPTDGFFEEEGNVPPVVGMATLSTGVRFQLADHFVARLEGGFKGWFFGGISLGGQFW